MSMNSDIRSAPYRPTPFYLLFIGKVALLMVTIIVVWMLYAYLHAYRLGWLGWSYAKLLPLTNWLYGVVESVFTGDTRDRIRAAITDDLGQRSLFLLLLTMSVELGLYCLFKAAKLAVQALIESRRPAAPPRATARR